MAIGVDRRSPPTGNRCSSVMMDDRSKGCGVDRRLFYIPLVLVIVSAYPLFQSRCISLILADCFDNVTCY